MDSLTDFNLFYDFFRIWGFGFVKYILRFFLRCRYFKRKGRKDF